MKPRGINHKTIRMENRKHILHLLIRDRELTIPEISRAINVSIPTVTKNIDQMIKEGIVEEAGVSESTIGRKPVMIRFCPDAYYSIGVEFAVGYVRIILTSLDSAIKADRRLRSVNYNDLDSLMRMIRHEVDSIILEKGISLQKILGMGISLPGPTDEEIKLLKVAPNLGLKHVDFTQYEHLFEFPLLIENDANAAAMAELTLGIAKTMQSLVYLCIMSKGIGCGIVIGGHLYRGRSKLAGEISHIRVASHGRQCSCGWRDCWELYASTDALLRMYQEKTGKILPSVHEFFVALKHYEPAAANVFDEYLDSVALGLQHIILLQDPHYVIVGGELSRFEEFFLTPLKARILVENSFYDNSTVEIICSILKENAFVLGASLLPFEKLFARHES